MRWPFDRLLASGAVIAGVATTGSVHAQTGAEFYKGRTVTIVISTGPAGAYDLSARTIGRHLPRYLPGGPAIVVRSMPGGGHTLATNYMANQAPRDGTTLALVSNTIPLHQALDGRGVRYDARTFNWLGTLGISSLVTWAWHGSGVTSIADAFTRDIITGATGAGSGTWLYPNAMNLVLGARFKIVTGYPNTAEVDLAMLRGEVMARSGASYIGYVMEHADWLREGKVRPLVQVGAAREKELAQVPLMHELARTDEQRRLLQLVSSPVKMGRPLFAPPEVPAERVALLRRAFDALMQDREFLAEAQSLSLEVVPQSGERVAEIVAETIDAPPALLAKARLLITTEESSAGPDKKRN